MGEKERDEIKHSIIVILLLVLSLNQAHANSIGVAPEQANLADYETQDLQPGKTYTYPLYFSLDNAREDVSVTLTFFPPRESQYWSAHKTEASEEIIQDWISFSESLPITIPVQREPQPVTLPDGTTVIYNKKLDVIITVPEDAEPGWHVGTVTINPVTTSNIGTPELRIFSLPRPIVHFRVEGEVKRELVAVNVRTNQTSDRSIIFGFDIENRGTVTTRISKGGETKIYDSQNREVASIGTLVGDVKPGETETLFIVWDSANPIPEGEYRIQTKIPYTTGETTYQSSFIAARMLAPPTQQGEQAPVVNAKESVFTECSIPVKTVLLVSLLVAMLVYWRQKNARTALMGGIISTLMIGAIYYVLCSKSLTFIILLVLLVLVGYRYWRNHT